MQKPSTIAATMIMRMINRETIIMAATAPPSRGRGGEGLVGGEVESLVEPLVGFVVGLTIGFVVGLTIGFVEEVEVGVVFTSSVSEIKKTE